MKIYLASFYSADLKKSADRFREQALKTNPYIRTLSSSPFFYKLISDELKNVFSDDIEWDASLFDGDGSLDAID